MFRRRQAFQFLNIASVVVPVAMLSLVLLGRWRDHRIAADIRQLIVSSGDQIHAAAVTLLNEAAATDASGVAIPVEELPEELRLPGVRAAIVAGDHIQLLEGHDASGRSGFRVWRHLPASGYADQSTAHPSIFRFSYSAADQRSANNRPD